MYVKVVLALPKLNLYVFFLFALQLYKHILLLKSWLWQQCDMNNVATFNYFSQFRSSINYLIFEPPILFPISWRHLINFEQLFFFLAVADYITGCSCAFAPPFCSCSCASRIRKWGPYPDDHCVPTWPTLLCLCVCSERDTETQIKRSIHRVDESRSYAEKLFRLLDNSWYLLDLSSRNL